AGGGVVDVVLVALAGEGGPAAHRAEARVAVVDDLRRRGGRGRDGEAERVGGARRVGGERECPAVGPGRGGVELDVEAGRTARDQRGGAEARGQAETGGKRDCPQCQIGRAR